MPLKNRAHNVWCATNKKLLIVLSSLKNRQLQRSVLGDELQTQAIWQLTKCQIAKEQTGCKEL